MRTAGVRGYRVGWGTRDAFKGGAYWRTQRWVLPTTSTSGTNGGVEHRPWPQPLSILKLGVSVPVARAPYPSTLPTPTIPSCTTTWSTSGPRRPFAKCFSIELPRDRVIKQPSHTHHTITHAHTHTHTRMHLDFTLSHLQNANWQNAENFCRSKSPSGHLVSIHTREDEAFLNSLVGTAGGPYWIGLQEIGTVPGVEAEAGPAGSDYSVASGYRCIRLLGTGTSQRGLEPRDDCWIGLQDIPYSPVCETHIFVSQLPTKTSGCLAHGHEFSVMSMRSDARKSRQKLGRVFLGCDVKERIRPRVFSAEVILFQTTCGGGWTGRSLTTTTSGRTSRAGTGTARPATTTATASSRCGTTPAAETTTRASAGWTCVSAH